MQAPDTRSDNASSEDQCKTSIKSNLDVQHKSGIFIVPNLTSLGAAIKRVAHDKQTHHLDTVPKDEVDLCNLSVRQFLILLQQTGLVSSNDGPKTGRGVSPQTALQAIRQSCYPSSTPAPVRSRMATWFHRLKCAIQFTQVHCL
jgi:hypothetical protein